MIELIAEDHLTATGKERLDLKYDQGETVSQAMRPDSEGLDKALFISGHS